MSEAIRCRWAEDKDFEAVRELSAQLARHIEEEQSPLALKAFLASHVGPEAPMKLLVAELDGAVAGLAAWTVVHELFSGRPALFLSDLAVDGGARGRGVGRALMDEVTAWARANGVRKLGWDVWRANASAMAFYEQQGAAADPETVTYRMRLS